MNYVILPESQDPKNRIHKLAYNRDSSNKNVCVRWDCYCKGENDLIVVVRTTDSKFQLNELDGYEHEYYSKNHEATVFVYSCRESSCHTENKRDSVAYNYYVYMGHLSDIGDIEIYDQTKDNIINKGQRPFMAAPHAKPELKVYYEWSIVFPILLYVGCAVAVLIVGAVLGASGMVLNYVCVGLLLLFIVGYAAFPSGYWWKRACICVVKQSSYSEKDIVTYSISNCGELYSICLTDIGNKIAIPLKIGKTITIINEDEIELEYMPYWKYIEWTLKKNRKGV